HSAERYQNQRHPAPTRSALSSGSVRKGTKFDCAKSWTENYGQNVCLRKYLPCDPERLRVTSRSARSILNGGNARRIACKILFLTVLDQFDLIAFRCVNEGNSTAVRRMWSVRQRMAFCGGVFGELVQVVDFKCEVRQIGADDNRAAPIEFAYLNFLFAAWRFQKHEL